MIQRILSASRFLIIIAVVCIVLAATTLLLYGSFLTTDTIVQTISRGYVTSKGAKKLVLSFIEIVDLFLLATVFYITAIGLYELFINDIDFPPFLNWLRITDIGILKDKLVGVIILVLAVVFLGQVVSWDGNRDLLNLGGSIAIMIAALTYFLGLKSKKDKKEEKTPKP
ncbi:MAG: YqhA family protein [Spirochaetota bacterium]